MPRSTKVKLLRDCRWFRIESSSGEIVISNRKDGEASDEHWFRIQPTIRKMVRKGHTVKVMLYLGNNPVPGWGPTA